MPDRAIKIATCCYCGRRTTLRERDHRLVCGSCGAPLTAMKPLRPGAARAAASHEPVTQPKPRSKHGGKRRRRPLWQKVVKELWDEIEDIFD